MATTPENGVISDVGEKYLRLQMTADVGPIRVRRLLDHFGDPDAIFSASREQLERVEGVGRRVCDSILRARNGQGDVEEQIRRTQECGVRIVCLVDDDYPAPLKQIPDPPTCLFVKGQLQPQDAVAISIVGTRRCSQYGLEQAMRFGELLAGAGFTVVSGLARGVDGHAHRGALRARGRTIAVLGNGLASIYPPEHAELADSICTSGAVISELGVDVGPEAKNFPGRNRIITGLTLGVLVIEAGNRSGALITARVANEYNREVFALPGNIDRSAQTAGSNALIRDGGAKLVTCLDDILDELADVGEVMRRQSNSTSSPESAPAATKPTDIQNNRLDRLTDAQRNVYDAIDGGATNLDAICETCDLGAGAVGSALTALELSGFIQRLPGSRVAIRSRCT